MQAAQQVPRRELGVRDHGRCPTTRSAARTLFLHRRPTGSGYRNNEHIFMEILN
ncbi:hypothetical protein Amsp01_002770 [Amycolatopsis sp. NBRC 101858]|nr:hypothetical protein Amsp01_002770 [Amycolatopsis sp. NBRC 101858]